MKIKSLKSINLHSCRHSVVYIVVFLIHLKVNVQLFCCPVRSWPESSLTSSCWLIIKGSWMKSVIFFSWPWVFVLHCGPSCRTCPWTWLSFGPLLIELWFTSSSPSANLSSAFSSTSFYAFEIVFALACRRYRHHFTSSHLLRLSFLFWQA